jgi:hypothetical protein
MASPAPLINGRRFSFASIEITLTGPTGPEVFADIDEISYSEDLEFEFRRGTSKIPLGSTSGVWTPQEGSMSMGKSTASQFLAQLGPGWLGINLLILIAFQDEGEPLCTDALTVRLKGPEDTHATGPEALKQVIKFMPVIPIVRNGVPSVL